MKRLASFLHYYNSGQTEHLKGVLLCARPSKLSNRSAILLHIPDDHGNAVKVILEEPMGRWSQLIRGPYSRVARRWARGNRKSAKP